MELDCCCYKGSMVTLNGVGLLLLQRQPGNMEWSWVVAVVKAGCLHGIGAIAVVAVQGVC